MDSKLKAIFITVVTLLCATVLLIVYGMNARQTVRPSSAVTPDALADSQASIQMQSEGSLSGSVYDQYALNPDKDPYAFLRDDDFFEKPEEEKDQSKVLSLQVSTIQKDLRIHIVNGLGQLLNGEMASVSVEYLAKKADKAASDEEADSDQNQKTDEKEKDTVSGQDGLRKPEYVDADEDGMIYVTNLKAGEYALKLKPVKGYEVPQEELLVKVSDEISYTVLDDISFLIRSEDEIDAKLEDTAVNEAELDADGTETNVRLEDGASVFGIDVSKWNKEIDWKKAKAAGVEFAIIRCGYRGSQTGALVEDPYFKQNIQGALDADVRVGLYFFTQAITPMEAVEEASMVLSLCRNYKISYPLFIDTEGAGGHGRADHLGKELRTQICKAFCETIENAGFTGGVYASKSWLNNNLDMSQLSGYEVWLAQYSKEATYEGEYDMWQYTSAGRIDGISTLVDFDISYRDF